MMMSSLYRLFITLFSLFLLVPVTYADAAAADKVKPIGSAQHLASVLVGLVAIILLIFVLAWFYRKASGGTWLRSAHIKIVGALALGTRERLLLVDVGGTQILLGVTAQNISRLHVFDEPVATANQAESESAFGEKLQAVLAGKIKPTSPDQSR